MKQNKKKDEEPLVALQHRTGLELETILGNKVQLFVDNIEEMIWYPTGIANIYTARMHYFVKMSALEFDQLVKIRGGSYEKDTI